MFNNQFFTGEKKPKHNLIFNFAYFCGVNTAILANWCQAASVSDGGVGKR